MCLIVFAWRPGHAQPLVLAANRDEFYDRPTLPLAPWDDAPQVLAGRDLEAGGAWLGLGAKGRFAALTNIRDPRQPPFGRSRGELVAEFLRGDLAPRAYLNELHARAGNYSGFNLLLADSQEFWFYNSREGQPQRLAAGLYGVSNATLDTPWPKLEKAKAALGEVLADPQPESLLAILGDSQQAPDASLPDTGIGLASEQLLSSVFIASRTYGTRACSALIVQADGQRLLVERSFGPYGGQLGEVRVQG
ncbi:MAG: NRDE family protein [Pseudomonas sp.]